MGDSEFDRATNPQPAGRQEPDGHRVDLSGGWSIGEAVNGGVIVAGMARAMALQSEGSQHNDPLVLSAFFLSGTKEAEATITTQLVRSGRSMSTVQGSLHQDLHSSDRPSHRVERVRATATFADLRLMSTSARTAARSTVQRPEFPPIEQCISPRAAPTGTGAGPPLLDRLDLRFDPATLGWAMGQPSGAGQMRAYFRLADGRENDLFTALLAVDALPPVSFDLGIPGWAPTLELTVHLRARPAAGWLRVSASTRHLAGGLLEEDVEVWDSEGTLVAMSRQLARVR